MLFDLVLVAFEAVVIAFFEGFVVDEVTFAFFELVCPLLVVTGRAVVFADAFGAAFLAAALVAAGLMADDANERVKLLRNDYYSANMQSKMNQLQYLIIFHRDNDDL